MSVVESGSAATERDSLLWSAPRWRNELRPPQSLLVAGAVVSWITLVPRPCAKPLGA
jgi:hypothetical protein